MQHYNGPPFTMQCIFLGPHLPPYVHGLRCTQGHMSIVLVPFMYAPPPAPRLQLPPPTPRRRFEISTTDVAAVPPRMSLLASAPATPPRKPALRRG